MGIIKLIIAFVLGAWCGVIIMALVASAREEERWKSQHH